MKPRKTLTTGWPIAAGLLALSAIPLAAGVARLVALTGVPNLADARFFAHPIPVQLHILGACVLCLGGVLLFWPGFQARFPRWHRRIGRVVAPADLVVGLTGLWMNQVYPGGPQDGVLLYIFRLVFGSAMVLALMLGVAAILRRDVARHRAWMMRAFAIGIGAGTQAVTQLPWILLMGPPPEIPRALMMGAAWVLNLAVAEWLIRRGIRTPSLSPLPTQDFQS